MSRASALRRRPTPAQRRAAYRLAHLAKSLRPPREQREPGAPADAGAPRPLALATPAAGGELARRRGRGRQVIRVEIPPALAVPDALPVLPVVTLGRKLALAIKRLDAFSTPLDLVKGPGG
ncbi:MAG: hypothetical protein IT318_04215 [Anaerolineales bacterium]|nr:hypothetical protein [Anaerolineales bacterium]